MNQKVCIQRMFMSLIFSVMYLLSFAQTRQISGMVKDMSGEPVIGVNVSVKGTGNGSITDLDGKFTIPNVKEKDVLVVSYIGYLTQSVSVGKQTSFIITLKEDTQALDEVVVVGYGVQKKRDLSGAVSSVKSRDITAIPTTNALEALQGKVAGLDLTASSGKAGADLSFTIRGERSLKASNAPLILVDGIDYGTTLDINPSDIESIEVLKDASSTAIYGTRGANGIIIVTTKKGKAGKSKVSLNAFASINMISSYPSIMNGAEYAQLKREAYRDQTTNEYLPDEQVFTVAQELEYVREGVSTDYRDLMMSNGFNQNYELSITGGTEKTQHSISLGYRGENGLFKNDNYKRLNARVALDHKLLENLKIGTNITYTYKDQNTRRDPLNMCNKIVPLSKPYDESGEVVRFPAPGYNSQTNPLVDDVDGAVKDNTKATRFFGSLYANWNITKDLLFRTTLGVDVRNKRRGYYCSANSLDGEGKDSKSLKEHTIESGITWENVLTYSKILGEHDFQIMGGTSTIYKSKEYTLASGKGQTYGGNIYHNLASNTKEVMIDSYLNEEKLASFFGRVNYKFMDRYILTASLRADGSSLLADGHKWGYFPSVAVAWRMNEESFLKGFDELSNLKLRLSYGIVGNQNGIGNYTTLGLTDQERYEFGDNSYMGYLPGKELSNPNLKWEQSRTANIGLDFGFFNNRLSGTIEYYNTRTTDLIVKREINSVLGYEQMLDNLGETKSHGIDISINGDVFRTKNFTWSLGANFSQYANEIVKIDNQVDENGKPLSQPGNSWFVGKPIHVYYDYLPDGIYQYEDFDIKRNAYGKLEYTLKPTIDTDGDGIADKALTREDNVAPGSVKIKDVNGDGKINADDRTPISRDPDFTLSLNTTLKWKGFDFYMDWYGVSGRKIRNGYLSESNSGGSLQGKLNGVKVNYWTPFNPSNEFPRPSHNTNVTYHGSLAIQDASYIRLRTLQLGYTFPTTWIKKLQLQKLRVYATATNLLTFTDFLSYSPELTPGAYPESKQYVFGINVSF